MFFCDTKQKLFLKNLGTLKMNHSMNKLPESYGLPSIMGENSSSSNPNCTFSCFLKNCQYMEKGHAIGFFENVLTEL